MRTIFDATLALLALLVIATGMWILIGGHEMLGWDPWPHGVATLAVMIAAALTAELV